MGSICDDGPASPGRDDGSGIREVPDINTLPGSWNSNVTIPPSVLTANARKGYRSVPVSFETGEQLTHKVWFTQSVKITGWRVQVTKALAATDAGTITLKDSSGANITPNAVLSMPASTAIAAEANQGAPTSANAVVAAGDFIQLVVAKTTAGGKANVYIEYEAQ